jgi:hypothetical protein
MNFRNTIIAIVVLAVIGGYALYVGKFSKPEETTQKLYRLKADDIAKIVLKYPERELELDRSKAFGQWSIVKPVGTDADQTASNNLARAIADCQLVRTVEDNPTDLKPFGLDKPQVTVTVTTFAGKTYPGIEVGKTTPIGFNAYIKETDKPAVMLTQSAFQSGMNKTLNNMRNRDLMNFTMDEVQKFVLAKDDGTTIEIDRDGDNWKIVKPASYKADDTQVREALSALLNAKVADFINDAPAAVTEYGLEKPHATATVYLKNGTQQSLLFGFKQTEAGKDGIYVRRGERAPVYTVHEYVMNDVDRSLLAFRDKTVFAFDPANVDSLNIKDESGTFTLKRAAGGKWDMVEGSKTSSADVPMVERFLDQLRDLKGNTIVADPMPSFMPFGLNTPAIDVTLFDKSGKQLGDMKLSKVSIKPTTPPAPGELPGPTTQYYAASSASKAVYSVSDYYFTQLNKPSRLFLSRGAIAPAASHAAAPAAAASSAAR